MFAISKLFSAVSTLAEALAELAATLTTANQELRQRLALGPAAEGAAPQLPAPDGESAAQQTAAGKRGRKGD